MTPFARRFGLANDCRETAAGKSLYKTSTGTSIQLLGIPMIATTRYDGSRPPIPIDRDQFDGAVGHSW